MAADFNVTLADRIQNFLEQDDWRYSFMEENGLFRFTLSLRGKMKKINYVIDVKENLYIVYATAPFGAEVENVEETAELVKFLTMANYGLIRGNFEFDYRDGEIRFKIATDCENMALSDEVIKSSVYVPGMMFERYGDGISGILFGGMRAEDAIRHCEGE